MIRHHFSQTHFPTVCLLSLPLTSSKASYSTGMVGNVEAVMLPMTASHLVFAIATTAIASYVLILISELRR